jgi:hypothetical protein
VRTTATILGTISVIGNAPQWRNHPLSPERRANRGTPNTYVSSIDVDDGGAAVAVVLAAPAGVYNVVEDEPLTKRA